MSLPLTLTPPLFILVQLSPSHPGAIWKSPRNLTSSVRSKCHPPSPPQQLAQHRVGSRRGLTPHECLMPGPPPGSWPLPWGAEESPSSPPPAPAHTHPPVCPSVSQAPVPRVRPPLLLPPWGWGPPPARPGQLHTQQAHPPGMGQSGRAAWGRRGGRGGTDTDSERSRRGGGGGHLCSSHCLQSFTRVIDTFRS